ncbi:hypothetical protein M440DRAFT_1013325 [Trichoderma longibrachiatum ATCC 18648]|uniref:Uncharacterized protein n=1 Tax=Trichoderma longibrachiatum ATCC 18648 TaxID=983965 RepID=A0A2T4CIE8_TRILO|nr:hypothetical protein M440DRAFT_1013325 [Trichoderma longibrachiatum ATCC 18648]
MLACNLNFEADQLEEGREAVDSITGCQETGRYTANGRRCRSRQRKQHQQLAAFFYVSAVLVAVEVTLRSLHHHGRGAPTRLRLSLLPRPARFPQGVMRLKESDPKPDRTRVPTCSPTDGKLQGSHS